MSPWSFHLTGSPQENGILFNFTETLARAAKLYPDQEVWGITEYHVK